MLLCNFFNSCKFYYSFPLTNKTQYHLLVEILSRWMCIITIYNFQFCPFIICNKCYFFFFFFYFRSMIHHLIIVREVLMIVVIVGALRRRTAALSSTLSIALFHRYIFVKMEKWILLRMDSISCLCFFYISMICYKI